MEPSALEPFGHRPPGGGAVELRIFASLDSQASRARQILNPSSPSLQDMPMVHRDGTSRASGKLEGQCSAVSRPGTGQVLNVERGGQSESCAKGGHIWHDGLREFHRSRSRQAREEGIPRDHSRREGRIPSAQFEPELHWACRPKGEREGFVRET